jgi:hypothetical protein
METKICSSCKLDKPYSEFHKNKSMKDGYHNNCKVCRHNFNIGNLNIKNKNKKYYEINKEKINEQNKEYRYKNKDNIKEYNKEYQKNNKTKILKKRKEWELNNKGKILKQQKDWRMVNSDKIKDYQVIYIKENKDKINEYYRIKHNTDPLTRLKKNIRNRIRQSFKVINVHKNNKTTLILGCSFEEFKEHIESQFEDWMNWDNHGLYNGDFNYGWDVDHRIPLSTAVNEDGVIKLNHFTNLRPLCSKVNRDIKR